MTTVWARSLIWLIPTCEGSLTPPRPSRRAPYRRRWQARRRTPPTTPRPAPRAVIVVVRCQGRTSRSEFATEPSRNWRRAEPGPAAEVCRAEADIGVEAEPSGEARRSRTPPSRVLLRAASRFARLASGLGLAGSSVSGFALRASRGRGATRDRVECFVLDQGASSRCRHGPSSAVRWARRMGASRRPGLAVALQALLALLAAVAAQVTEPGICPFSVPLPDWNEQQFVAGPWFEMKAFAVPGLHTARPGCTRWHFSPSENGLGLHARLAYRTGGGDASVRAFARYTASEKHPRFNLTFHDLDGAGSARSVHMRLVATDYDDFALLWGCTEPNLLERKVVSWVLSRRPFLSDNAQDALRGLFRAHDIRPENLVDTDHDAGTCGAEATGQTDGVLATYSKLDPPAAPVQDDDDVFQADQPASPAAQRQAADGGDDAGSVSASYVGSGWLEEALGAQATLVASLLALALVSLAASLVAFRVLIGRAQGGRRKPVLPVHRQDVVVATLGAGVDYGRFGGLGNVQTRKHAGLGPGSGLVGGDPADA